MWFPDLTGLAVNGDTAFILLAWAELFGERTPNTYTARLHDTFSLIRELGDVAGEAETDEKWLKHLSHVLEELHSSAKSDSVLARHYPQLQYSIQMLNAGAVKASRIVHFTDVLLEQMSDYESRVFEHLMENIGLLPREKEKALGSIRRVATRAVQRGLVREEMRAAVSEEMFTLSPEKAAQRLIDSLTRQQREWTIIIGIEGKPESVEALSGSSGLKKLRNREKPLGQVGKDFFQRMEVADKPETVFQAITKIEAGHSLEAVQKALSPLRLVLDVANFAHRGAPFKILPFVYIETADFQKIIDLDAGSYAGIEPQRNATRYAVDLQRKGILKNLPEQVITSLEQHSVAHASTDPKIRFVNLWVALETLVGHERDTSIIDEIIRKVTPLIVHRRVNKIIKYLAISLHNFGFCGTVANTTGWFGHSNRFEIRRDELLLALTGAAGQPVADELARLTLSHPVLCNRLFTVHNVISDPAELTKQLIESKKRSEWQLRRIYRTRNILVHTGATVSLLPQLTNDLEYYYSLTLSRILHDFERHENWSVEKSFEYRRQMYEYLTHCLKDDASRITVNDVLQHDMGSLGRNQLWSPV